MPRRRIAVVLVPPYEVSLVLRGLRQMIGGGEFSRIEPHITLIPPVNLSEGSLQSVLVEIRKVAIGTDEFDLRLGPADSFSPGAPTVHLQIHCAGESNALDNLRSRLFAAFPERLDDRRFVAHLTVLSNAPPDRIDAAMRLLDGSIQVHTAEADSGWTVDRLRVLEHHRDSLGTYWANLVEEPFGAATVVGRGGHAITIRTVSILEPASIELLRRWEHRDPGAIGESPRDQRDAETADRLCLVAEMIDSPNIPIGVVVGSASGLGAKIDAVFVREDSRNMGIARQLVSHFEFASAKRGSVVVAARAIADAGFLSSLGYSRLDSLFVRSLHTS